MKTFDKKDVYSWANCDELRLATQGYAGNSLSGLACNPDGIVQLLSIDESRALCFTVESNQDNLAKVYHCAFFVPIDKVKEEKKWRAFKNLEEFKTELNSIEYGDVVRFRQKSDHAIMKLKDFLEIVYDYEELSIFNAGSSDYVLHRVSKNEVIEKYPELLDREIDYVNVHWFEDTGATLGIVLM